MGQGSSIAMSCGIGHRRGSDSELLCLWLWLAAVAPIRPLAWEPPYAVGMALRSKKKKIPREDTDCHGQHHPLRKVVTFMAPIELTNYYYYYYYFVF